MMELHPFCEMFPRLEGSAFDDLVASIKDSGLREPIVLYNGAILDGRNRFCACEVADVEPCFETFEGTDEEALTYAIDLNVNRRHLNETQRAFIGARLADMRQGERTDLIETSTKLSQTDAGEQLSVHRASVNMANKVLESGLQSLVTLCDRGILAVSLAYSIVKDDDLREQADDIAAALEANAEKDKPGQPAGIVAPFRAAVRHRKIKAQAADKKLGRRYPIIYADPPWQWETYSETGRAATPDQHYELLDMDQIFAYEVSGLPVAERATKDAILFLWATVPTLPAAMQCIEAWGFKYVSQMCWDKVRPGLGYWARNQHELLLIATKGSFPAPDGKLRKASLQSIEKGEHSAKPPEFRTAIEEMFPMYVGQEPPLMLEIFGRGEAPFGWEFYGYEAHDASESEAA